MKVTKTGAKRDITSIIHPSNQILKFHPGYIPMISSGRCFTSVKGRCAMQEIGSPTQSKKLRNFLVRKKGNPRRMAKEETPRATNPS